MTGPWIAGVIGIRNQHWMDDAACASVGDFTAWFPETGEGQAEQADMARRICLSCPVKDQCRDYATEAGEWGIWGATSRDERKGYSDIRQPAPKQPPAMCRKGHEYTPENTAWEGGGKYRRCRTCARARQKRADVRRGKSAA